MIDATKLRSLRTDRGYSIRRIAAAAGVDHQTIRRLEDGADPGELPLRVLGRIATSLGVTPAALLSAPAGHHTHALQRRIGGTILSAPGITVTTLADALNTTVDNIQAALPALQQALAGTGLTVARHGDELRITPADLHTTPDAYTRPMTVNEARLLRRVHRGTDVRRSLSKADRELTLPALTRRGLVDATAAIPTPGSQVLRPLAIED